jgi:hypothetical protein
MNQDISDKPEAPAIPASAADAWAAVYIDVVEKFDAEEQEPGADACPTPADAGAAADHARPAA